MSFQYFEHSWKWRKLRHLDQKTAQIYEIEVLLSILAQFLLMVSIKGDVIDTKNIL